MQTTSNRIFVLLALAASALSAPAQNLVANGSFEINAVAAGATHGQTLHAAQTTLPSWTVSGGIDLHRNYWDSYAADGTLSPSAFSVDLDGTYEAGGVQQSLATPAAPLSLTFRLGGNYYGTPPVKRVEVYWNSASLGIFDYTIPTGQTREHFSWIPIALSVQGTGGTDTLRFESRTGSGWGAVIDDVSVQAVPEPSALAALALGAVALVRRRRRV